MTYDFRLSCTLPASPEAVYDAWLESGRHGEMTAAKAPPSASGSATAIPLGTATLPAKRWSSFRPGASSSAGAPPTSTKSDPDSTIAVDLEPTKSGTRLTLWTKINRRFIAMGAAGWHICFDVMDHLLAGEPLGRIVGPEGMKLPAFQRLHAEYAKQFGIAIPKV